MKWLAAQWWWLPPIVATDLIPNLFGGKFGEEWLRTKPTFLFFPAIFLTISCHCPNNHPYHRKSSLPPLRRCYRHGATKELGLRQAWISKHWFLYHLNEICLFHTKEKLCNLFVVNFFIL
jgi:hypothetical protein